MKIRVLHYAVGITTRFCVMTMEAIALRPHTESCGGTRSSISVPILPSVE
jgi:hypothetical protein